MTERFRKEADGRFPSFRSLELCDSQDAMPETICPDEPFDKKADNMSQGHYSEFQSSAYDYIVFGHIYHNRKNRGARPVCYKPAPRNQGKILNYVNTV